MLKVWGLSSPSLSVTGPSSIISNLSWGQHQQAKQNIN